MKRRDFITLLSGAAAWPKEWWIRKMLITRLIAAALMLPMPNAYAETQTASHMITTAAAITLYKIHCSGKIPASAVETVNTTIRSHRRCKSVSRRPSASSSSHQQRW